MHDEKVFIHVRKTTPMGTAVTTISDSYNISPSYQADAIKFTWTSETISVFELISNTIEWREQQSDKPNEKEKTEESVG
jgi:hypothetical protein